VKATLAADTNTSDEEPFPSQRPMISEVDLEEKSLTSGEAKWTEPIWRARRALVEWGAHLLVVAGLLIGFRLVELLIARLWPDADRRLFGVLPLKYIFDAADLAVLIGLLTYGIWCVIKAYGRRR